MALLEERREAHLRRVDRARNMARFYTLSVEMALFDSWSCTKAYGRIGLAMGASWSASTPTRRKRSRRSARCCGRS